MAQPPDPVRVVEVLRRLSRGAGIQIVIRRLAEHVDPAEVEMHAVTVTPWQERDQLDRLAIEVHPLGYKGPRYSPIERVRIMAGVARQVSRAHAEVVHLHSGSSWLGLAARFWSPRSHFLLDVHDAPGSGRHGRATDWLEGKWGSWLGAHVVCHSEPVATEIHRHWRLDPKRLTVVPLAVDTTVFAPADAEVREQWRGTHGVGDDQLVLVVAGRLAPSKRFDRAIDVLGLLRAKGCDAALVVVGAGGEESTLRERAEADDTRGHVVFTGAQFGEDLAAAFAAADVLCSTSEYEGFGLTLIEGMSCGLPVVAVSVGGVTDLVVHGETGFLIGIDEFEAFAERVAELADDEAMRRRMGEAGRRRVEERFGAADFAREFTALFRRIARPDG